MEMSGQLHAPAALPHRNKPLVPIGEEARGGGGGGTLLDNLQKIKI
jgi:hypothetical protein